MATPIPDNEARFTRDEIVALTGAVHRGPGVDVAGVLLDSRRARSGSLFVALRGETHDAHAFVDQAVASGAQAVVVDREVAVDARVDVYRVDDTLAALGALASHHRARSGVQVVGITGSVGKTTTKELASAALRGAGRRVHATEGNLNNRIGVPMTLLQLTESHDTAVIEMGMSVPGEIAALAEMARPDVGVVTAVAEVHTEGVGGLEGVAREKGALLLALEASGAAVYCADEAPLHAYAERSPAMTKIGYGRADGAAVRLASCALASDGTRYALQIDGATHAGRLQLLGDAAALNTAGAAAVTLALAPDRLSDALAAMAEVAPRPQRMSPREVGELLILDDSYNASPRSTEAAIRAGVELARARGGRLIAVLADMLELGAAEEALHERLGHDAARLGVGALVLHGERMAAAARGALRAGGGVPVRVLAKIEAVAPAVRELAGPGDVVLVKGSRGMRMERVVVALAEVPA